MRNPLARLVHRDADKPSLRERLNATKAKAKQVIAVSRVLMKPEAPKAPAVERAALVNYATWLAFERERVCVELYPHMGAKASHFVLTLNAAERFFFPDGINNGRSKAWRTVPPASSRAVKVLDLVGVDWRGDRTEEASRHFDEYPRADTGERPALPFAWPEPDAALLEALDDLDRLDAALEAFHDAGTDGRDGDEVPGYDAVEDAREDAIARLAKERASSLVGLQIKARAVLRPSVDGSVCPRRDDLRNSLARDVLGITPRDFEPRPDPIFVAIEEGRRLLAISDAAFAIPVPPKGDTPKWIEEATGSALDNLVDHCRGVLLQIVPQTAAGCRELARFAVEYFKHQGVPIVDDEQAVTSLIARSPLL